MKNCLEKQLVLCLVIMQLVWTWHFLKPQWHLFFNLQLSRSLERRILVEMSRCSRWLTHRACVSHPWEPPTTLDTLRGACRRPDPIGRRARRRVGMQQLPRLRNFYLPFTPPPPDNVSGSSRLEVRTRFHELIVNYRLSLVSSTQGWASCYRAVD